MTDTHTSLPRRATEALYGLYALTVFIVGVSAAVLAALLVPGLERRRRYVAGCARAFFALAGIRVTVQGLERLPIVPCVVVANHASYLDGVILQAFLPVRFAYVIKNDMQKIPVAHFLLRRIGARFVERYQAAGGARDARQLMRAADGGASLVLFPEGTFTEKLGLGKFHRGAFAIAIKGLTPLVPLVIRGSRHILPAGARLPRRGRLSIDVLAPILPAQPDFADHQTLAAEARRRMLSVLDEPDLMAERGG